MLQHTWDRADRLSGPEHILTVMAQHHLMACSQMERQKGGKVIFQPQNCGTAAGVFLPLTYVRAWDPKATVVLFPSDHFIFPEDLFLAQVRKVANATHWFADRLVLLGVAPTKIEIEYGWIEPGEILGLYEGTPVKAVKTFLEKPDRLTALTALSEGALWNTMVMGGKVETFWSLGCQCFPEVMVQFEQLGEAIGTPLEGVILNEIYRDMPQRNFSSDLLQRVPERVGVVELEDVLWSDWGHPARIAEILSQIGGKPSFDRKHLGISESLDIPAKQLMEVK